MLAGCFSAWFGTGPVSALGAEAVSEYGSVAGSGVVAAQREVTFEVAAPTAVEAGELFRIEFVINALGVDFTPPAIDGFEVMAGPSESRGTSVSIINGQSTRTETPTYTYVLQGFTPGLHTIAGARATVNGTGYSTHPVTIEVVAASGSGSNRGNSGDNAASSAA